MPHNTQHRRRRWKDDQRQDEIGVAYRENSSAGVYVKITAVQINGQEMPPQAAAEAMADHFLDAFTQGTQGAQ